MQLSSKRSIADHLSSTGSNHEPQRRRPRKSIQPPDRISLEEHLHLLQHSHPYYSPSEGSHVENNSTSTPLLWHQPSPQLPPSRHTEKSWNVSSLFECCPMSPSPVCSPFISNVSNGCSHMSNAYAQGSNACSHVSHLKTDDGLFTAKNSCLVESDNKRSTSYPEIQEANDDEVKEEFTLEKPEFNYSQPNLQKTPNRLQATPNRLLNPYGHQYDEQYQRALRFSNQGMARRTVPAKDISCQHNLYETGHLSGPRANSRQRDLPVLTMPTQASSVGGWNRRSVEGYYLGDDENSLRCIPRQLGHSTLARSQGSQIEAQIKALEERNVKLLNRLRKQEQAIENWKRRQIHKAKEKMRQIEMKLELERRTALEKAKKDIEHAQRKAEKRKHEEQNETAKKLARSHDAIEKISCVGKVLWKLACF